MNNYTFFFLLCDSNDLFHGKVKTCVLSSEYSLRTNNRSKSSAIFVDQDILRKSIVVYSIRSLPIHTWMNTNNLFLGREN